jgi:nucleotide-binding universal stress UspA family protein
MSSTIKFKVLFPTDFSDVSRKARPYLTGLKAMGLEHVVLLNVVNERRVRSMAQGAVWFGRDLASFQEDVFKELEEAARKKMKALKETLEEAGVDKVTIRIERGIPHTKILEVEAEEKPDVLVLGSHGRSNVAELLLGSVSEHVIRHCSSPVFVVKR